MTYEQLSRCYQTVMSQRDEAWCEIMELQHKLDTTHDALEDIKKHQQTVGGEIAVMSTTWRIADKAIKAI